jgi:hypothetical protein
MKTRRLLFSLVLGLGLTLAMLAGLDGNLPRARAATYTVTNTDASGPGSLRQAILDANGNPGHDTIDFSVSGAIVLADALPAINDDLTITGPGAEQLAVSGDNAYQVFHINNGAAVTITGLTVRDGSAVSGGGVWSAGDLHLGAAHIFSNAASISGGGVYVEAGSATLSGTQVLSNSAGAGGGVYVYRGGATLNVSGGEVGSNSASINGGGVYVLGGDATLSGTQVVSNSAGYGGGVYVYWGSATLNGTPVIRNSAVYSGGGVFVNDGSGTLNVSGGEVGSNSADYGGGVYVDEGSATLSGTQVLSNSAYINGGGVYVYLGQATLSGGQILSNSAGGATSGDGGGVYVYEGSATLSGTQVVSNSAYTGGGVYIRYGSATLSEGQILSNSAGLHGGGVYVYGGSATLNVSRGEIGSNSAYRGGGVYVYGGSMTLNGTQVVNNSAVYYGYGGGVYVSSGSATLNGTQVVSNSAYRGGGLYLLSSTGAITATDGCIVYNSDTAVDNNSTGTLNARDNWWGMPDGPSGVGPGSGDSVSVNVDYANFETSPPAGCPVYRPDLTIFLPLVLRNN